MKKIKTLLLLVLMGTFYMSNGQNAKGFLNPYPELKKLETMDQLDYKFPVKKVILGNDIELAYTDMGSGNKTIIFIHGLGSYLPAWDKNVEELSKNYRCIAIDLPGYGKSSKNPHSGMMSFYASVIREFADKLQLKNVVLAGHSMGGQIAMMAELKYPGWLENLVLIAPAGFESFTKGQKQWFRNVMTLDGVRLTTAEDIQTNLAVNFYNMPKDARFMITDRIAMRSAKDFDAYAYAVVQSVNGMVDEPVIDLLDKIQVPTLIVFGKYDNLIPNRYLNPGSTVKIAEIGHSRIPNSTLLIVPKAGHFVQFEKPVEVNAAIKGFLK